MGQDLTPLVVPGAVIAFQIAWGERPVCTPMFDAGTIVEMLARIEAKYQIVPSERDEPAIHGHMQRVALKLIQDNPDPAERDWVPVAAATLLWCAFHYPEFGARTVHRAAQLLRAKGRATLACEFRDGGMWFEVFDLASPAAAAAPADA